jgi:hypothetical protein
MSSQDRRLGDSLGPYAKDGATAGQIKTRVMDQLDTVMNPASLAVVRDDLLPEVAGNDPPTPVCDSVALCLCCSLCVTVWPCACVAACVLHTKRFVFLGHVFHTCSWRRGAHCVAVNPVCASPFFSCQLPGQLCGSVSRVSCVSSCVQVGCTAGCTAVLLPRSGRFSLLEDLLRLALDSTHRLAPRTAGRECRQLRLAACPHLLTYHVWGDAQHTPAHLPCACADTQPQHRHSPCV